ncbi:helix-turn-helix domain-containing protein [uncultured Dysosmobacter sp.]|uniref:helix-turn-helix domain-containing protein n=1 Tax=uncultured Dysosmobacter sp. TaxID=2591384 RepID=UPI00262428B1|nr:helix-turn-helix transcriptional regulator [uncultured Dysosmobacter sp.]
MTLGQRISQYRKGLGISQEELGARLGVSRQAVSKWETGAAAPDMNNLMALAREFNISLAELTETPDEPVSKAREDAADVPEPTPRQSSGSHRSFRSMVCAVSAVFLLLAVAVAFFYDWTIAAVPGKDALVDAVTATFDEPPTRYPATDFALLWTNSDGNEEFLELGAQEDFFPFGTSLELTAPEEVLDTDFHLTVLHNAVCGAINLSYLHTEQDLEMDPASVECESVIRLSTIAPSVHTPQWIHVGSTKADVVKAYGDELVYCLKEEGGYTLVPHDYYYIYQPKSAFSLYLAIYMRDGLVAGLLMEDLIDAGNEFFLPNNVSRFPTISGEPDFSQRQEPEREDIDDTRRVYIAWNQLVTNNNLSAEERYAYRRDAFSLLPDMDWGELKKMGHTNQDDDTPSAFMWWLSSQDDYSYSEILWIQMGCTARGLDGAYSESYSNILSSTFFYNPVVFAKALTADGVDEEVKWHAICSTAYDAELYPVELQTALDTLDAAIDGGSFTEVELGWAKLLRLYLVTPINERNELPKAPAELI